MNIAPELAAFIGRAPPAQPRGTPVIGACDCGARIKDSRSTTEEPMPTGVYPRKKKDSTEAGKPAAKPAKVKGRPATKQAAPNAPQKPAGGPRFGIFEDGSIELRVPGCTGRIRPADARDLVTFMARIGVK